MNYIKRHIAVFLCMLFAFTTVMMALPQGQVKAAEKIRMTWDFPYTSGGERVVQVKRGAENLYIGDYLFVVDLSGDVDIYNYCSNLSGVSYKSSQPSVVAINAKTGEMNAKKNGTSEITVKYKGKKRHCTIKVVDEVPSYFDKRHYREVPDKYAGDFIKEFGTEITSKNRYKLLSIYKLADEWVVGSNGVYTKNIFEKKEMFCAICEPTIGRANALARKFGIYAQERNPFLGGSAKQIKITKLSGSKKTITATISKKVDADQIFGAQYVYGWDSKASEKRTVDFPVYIRDTRDGYKYYAVATLKKGSNKITIKTKNLKLKKNVKYELRVYDRFPDRAGDWLKGSKVTTFKAK